MKRGIIASPNKTIRTSMTGVGFLPNITIQDFYYYILYWDKVVMPTNNIIHQGVPHEEMLIKEGVLERPTVRFQSWNTINSPDMIVESQKIVANELLKKSKDIDWTIHQLGDKTDLGNNLVKEFHSIRVELNNALPVPTKEVSIDEILNFKQNRRSELTELHDTLDKFYLEIVNATDKNFQSKKSFEELNKAIENVGRVANEKFATSSKYNFIAELNANLGQIYTGVSSGVALGYFYDPTIIPLTAIAGAVLPFLTLKANKTYTVEEAKGKLKLNYLANAKKEHII